jgi:site-specific DNA-methyltransferase (adenine-specific)
MNQTPGEVILGDSLDSMKRIESTSIDLVYLDPPFFTNRHHSAVTRDRTKKFSFSDAWNDLSEYAEFMETRLKEVHRVLKDTGSVFVHCDKSANFLLRVLLDSIFGTEQFRSEIIWTYRRWSNSAKGLMPAHQTLLFYSISNQFKFNRIYGAYSETTNIDQILQLRTRDAHGVSAYATNQDGEIIYCDEKKGVPLSDVWEIPFLNPKAKERTGYPTQKPILLLERVIEIATDPGDLVLDPFCGSGTTLVAAKLLGRNSIGMDSSEEAVILARQRLADPEKTESALLRKGRAAYANADKDALALLQGLDLVPVQRNIGIDAFLKISTQPSLVPVRVQRQGEALSEAAQKLYQAAKSKNAARAILIRTHEDIKQLFGTPLPESILVVDAPVFQIKQKISEIVFDLSVGILEKKQNFQPTAASDQKAVR